MTYYKTIWGKKKKSLNNINVILTEKEKIKWYILGEKPRNNLFYV